MTEDDWTAPDGYVWYRNPKGTFPARLIRKMVADTAVAIREVPPVANNFSSSAVALAALKSVREQLADCVSLEEVRARLNQATDNAGWEWVP